MGSFTRSKFLALPSAQRHKKCYELLRDLYENPSEERGQQYEEFCLWLELEAAVTPKQISDRFHWHLQQAGASVKEHRLLKTQGDREAGCRPLPIAIYLDHIRSAHNVGSIVRTTEALRVGRLYFSENMADCNHKQVKDSAMGCERWVESSRAATLDALPQPIVCLERAECAISLYDFIFPTEFTLVVGNEEYGCSDAALLRADYLLQIPMYGRKNSLNVANAFAATAAEIRRQHQFKARGS